MKNTKEVKIGDTVTFTPTGQRVKVLDIFTRDGVKLIEVQVGDGRTTTATEKWFRAIDNE